MSVIEAIIQGIIQGATEFLPVSSTGHLSLFQYFAGINEHGNEGFIFDVLLHLGTLIAVFIVFNKTILELVLEVFSTLKDIFTGKFSFKNMSGTRKMLMFLILSTAVTVTVMLIPMPGDFLGGGFLMDVFERTAVDNDIVIEGICYLITGTLLLFATKVSEKNMKRDITYKGAIAIGVAQGIAGLPGISRSGSTSSAGLMMGLSREYVVRYTFILSIPAILGANIVKLGDIAKELGDPQSSITAFPLLVGIVVSAVVGAAAIKLIAWLIKTNKLMFFSYYCYAVGAIALICGIIEHIFNRPIQGFIVGLIS